MDNGFNLVVKDKTYTFYNLSQIELYFDTNNLINNFQLY